MYDPQIGRWHSVDPLGEFYYKWSPYSNCFDNPIRYLDPYGLGIRDWWRKIRDAAKIERNNKIKWRIELPEVIITAKNSKKKEDYHPPMIYCDETGISLTGSNASGSGNPNAKIWFEINWDFLTDWTFAFDPIPSPLKTTPDPPGSDKSSKKKTGQETSDEQIYEENTGNSKEASPEKNTIVKTFYGKGKYKNWTGTRTTSGSILFKAPTGDSTLLINSKGDSILFAPLFEEGNIYVTPLENKK
jgi:hypothetical protein